MVPLPRRFSGLFFALIVLSATAQPRGEDDLRGVVPEALRADLMHQRWEDALGRLDKLRTTQPADADLWIYLSAVARDRSGQDEAALALLRSIERDHPESDWVHKAHFRQAEILRARRDFEGAERMYEEALARLRSNERQGELGDIYLEFADGLSTPSKIARPDEGDLDYRRAAELYRKVLELDTPRDRQDKATFRVAWCLEKLGDAGGAVRAYGAYLDKFAAERQHPLPAEFLCGTRVWEARLQLGINEQANGQAAGARRTLEDLCADLGEFLKGADLDDERREALTDMHGQARYRVAWTYGSDRNSSLLAITNIKGFLTDFPTHDWATRAAFELPTKYQLIGFWEEALDGYRAVAERPRPGQATTEVLEEHARLTTLALYSRGAVLQGQERFDEAVSDYAEYTRRYPSGPNWSDCQRGIVDCAYQRGTALRNRELFDEAREAWERFLADHPLDDRVQQVQFDLGSLFAEEASLARRTDEDADVSETLNSAVAHWLHLADKYPGSHHASLALYTSGLQLELELDDLPRAIEVYRRCDFGPRADACRARLVGMTEPSLALVTERIWRSHETPKVLLRLRNIEEYEVKLYRLDLEAYFRKHLTHRRIEDLDLDLIAPDERREESVDDYREYAPLERHVELDFEGAGVWALSVTAGELRATTLVVRSDVEIIVKSSRREVFVFAQNMRLDEPAQGVQILLGIPQGDGQTTLEQLVTDENGIARLQLDALQEANELRVLAMREGHFASNGLTLGGLSVSRGLQPRAHITTDRTAYQPGDSVRLRAVVREVQEGSYTFHEGSLYHVSVTDSRGRPLFNRSLPLSAFGTLNHAFTLPAQAALGRYSVLVEGPTLPRTVGTFQVDVYQLQKVELDFEHERSVYYRGEVIEVTARARFYYGEPVTSSPLVVTLPDGRQVQLETDEKGEAQFTIETRDFPNEGPLTFHAHLRAENVSSTGQVYLATRGFTIQLRTDKNVVLAGDSFAVNVNTVTPDGEGCERKLHLAVLQRRSRRGGTWAEDVITEHTLQTDEDGQGQWTLALEKGGEYTLRATGEDRFGNTISAEHSLYVSGTDDSVRLRMLTESTRTEVGQTLSLDLLNRAGPGLALITFEGESILDYRLIQLSPEHNAIELEVDHQHFPNFRVSAAFMRGNEFFEASTDLEVERALTVQVKPAAESVQPGGTLRIDVEVTDQLGRPVEAELCLAIVDAALFQRFPDNAPAMVAFFEEGARRDAGLRTATSCTFRYQGQTVRISEEILAENQRLEGEAIWAAELDDSLLRLNALGYGDGDKAATRESGRDALRSLSRNGLSLDAISNRTAKGGQLDAAGLKSLSALGYIGGGGGAGGFQNTVGNGRTLDLAQQRFGSRGRKSVRMIPPTPEPAMYDADTAFWSPSVVTNAQGKASLEITLPDKATRWRITGRGVSASTLVGETRSTFITRSDFFVELVAPASCVEGDRPRIRARVHNLTGEEGTVRLSLRVSTDEGIRVLPAQIELGIAPLVDYTFPALEALPASTHILELSADVRFGNGERIESRAREELPVRPWGLEFSSSHSGPIADTSTFWLELPKGRDYSGRKLDLYLGPNLNRWLIDEAFGRLGFLQSNRHLGGVSQSATAADLRGALAVLANLGTSGRRGHPEYAALRSHAQGLAAGLVASQQSDGGWRWLGRAGRSTAQTSADVLIALGAARNAGLELPPSTLEAAVSYLQKSFAALSGPTNELKATLTHALAALGKGDFGAANRLFRERNQLSSAALAHLCLAFVHMQREPMAAEVARLLEVEMQVASNPNTPTPEVFCSVRGNKGWSRSRLGMTALALNALQLSLPSSPKIAQAANYLLSHRPWAADIGRGLAVVAMAEQARNSDRPQSDARVRVEIAGLDAQVVELKARAAGRFLSFPLGEVRERRVRVDLQHAGGGEPQFSAVLTGFSSTLDKTRRGEQDFRLTLEDYLAKAPLFDGRALSTGFSVLRSYEKHWNNRVQNLESGALTHVRLYMQRDDRQAEEDVDHLVLEVPLPAGAHLLEGSLRGGLGTYEIRGGSMFVPIGPMRGSSAVEFDLVGAVAGDYRVLPPVLRSAYEPERFAIGSTRTLSVLQRGVPSPDEYRPTPDELFNHGRGLYRAGAAQQAHAKLEALYEKFAPLLRDRQLKETANMLLYLSIDRHDSSAIVKYFEVIKEKDPELFIPFDKVVAIGQAYRDLGEFERALLIFVATIEETFGKDLKVAGALREQGERAGALDTLEQLCREYPDTPNVIDTWLALSDEMLLAAKDAHRDPSLKKAGHTRASLTEDGILLLRRLLAMHPTGPSTPAAALNLVSAYLALEDRETTSALAGDMATLFSDPRYADAFLYTRAVAEWHLKREDESIQLLQRIVEAEYTDERGNVSHSENRDLALYILGQIYHARRDPDQASEYYERVKDLFSDAAEALAGFAERRLALDEITTAQPGQPVILTMRHKNLEEVEILVYEVDLMTLYLREKNLTNVTSINLAGISPTLRKTVQLSAGNALRTEETEASLDLTRPGAYLVICRGGSLHTSGLVLITQLELDVHSDPQSGRIRVQATSTVDQRYLHEVDVRVIGSANNSFTSGETDPRGIFVADGVRGSATVIARHGQAHYAFYRGTQLLAQPSAPTRGQRAQTLMNDGFFFEQKESNAYFSNVMEMNRAIQGKRGGNLQEMIQRDRKGVQVLSVK
jgi:tetratricopeptide (TPR) repeat protein